MKFSNQFIPNSFRFGIFILSFGIPAVFVFFWDVFFTSDYALIGLIAKRFLETSELPLYVWNAGYQGLLIEVPLVAIFLKLFGITPTALHLGPYLLSCLFFWIYFTVNKNEFGQKRAWVALFFLITLSPYLYSKIVRTQPNYGEIFILGLSLFWLVQKGSATRKTAFLFGFVFGFGLYIYEQILFFAAPLVVGLLWSFWKTESKGNQRSGILKKLLIFFTGAILFFLLMWVFECRGFEMVSIRIRWSNVSTLKILTLLLVSVEFYRFRNQIARWLLKYRGLVLWGVLGLLIGKSPSWIAQALNPVKILRQGGLHEDFFFFYQNIEIAFKGISFFVFQTKNLFLGVLVFSIGFLGLLFSERRQSSSQRVPYLWTLFSVFILFIFCIARATEDENHIRYLTVLLIPLSLGLSYWAIEWVSRLSKFEGPYMRLKPVILVAGLFGWLGFTAYGLSRFIHQHRSHALYESVIQEMDKKEITRGAADYWVAYAINFITQERILLEPLESAYSPYIRSEVEKQNRIVLIDLNDSKRWPEPNSVISVFDSEYRVREKSVLKPSFVSIPQSIETEERVRNSGFLFWVLDRVPKAK